MPEIKRILGREKGHHLLELRRMAPICEWVVGWRVHSEERTSVFGKPEAPGLPETPARRRCSHGREGFQADGRGPQASTGLSLSTQGALGPSSSLRRSGQP